jgi:predicted TIM-barrel fold metal-dependent hydrolase
LAKASRSARVRSRLKHPVIDVDGHVVELTPVYVDYIAKVGGHEMAERYLNSPLVKSSYQQSLLGTTIDERRDGGSAMTSWWFNPTKNSLDRVTSAVPRLLYERLDELGFDMTILYPSEGLYAMTIADAEVRQAVCRAYNTFAAETFDGYADRILSVAVVPMHTPEEAVAELEYAVNTLGHKLAVFPCHVSRPVPRFDREHPDVAGAVTRMDMLALDSEYDYDPVWQACLDLGIAPGFHGGSQGVGLRRSISNFVFNHIGNAAASNEAMAKALVLGGVTRRFPGLRCSFLEGGANWAYGLYSDLIGHWEKRNVNALENLDPSNIDPDALMRLVEEYASDGVRAKADAIRAYFSRELPRPDTYDDFTRIAVEDPAEFCDLFARPFFFGCEADDPMNAHAANTQVNPFDARIQIVFGSDIGHWDVPDMNEVLAEAYEPVERGVMSEDAFEDFMFRNAVRLYAGANPDFFRGTIVEGAAQTLLEGQPEG